MVLVVVGRHRRGGMARVDLTLKLELVIWVISGALSGSAGIIRLKLQGPLRCRRGWVVDLVFGGQRPL